MLHNMLTVAKELRKNLSRLAVEVEKEQFRIPHARWMELSVLISPSELCK